MASNVKLIKIPFDINSKNYSYDYSIVSYKDGNPEKPRVGTQARDEQQYLIKNIKQVMKYNLKDRNRQSLWKEENFIFNEKMDLERFKPDLPYFSFKTLIEKIVINQIGSYLELHNKKEKFQEIDLLFGIPVFSNVEGMPEKQRNKFKEEYKNNIKNILKKLGVKNKVHFLYEPFAIIRHALHNKLLNFKEQLNRILIIDFGGSTFNCCVVSSTNEGTIPQTQKYRNVYGTNYNPWGCSEVDKLILENLIKPKLKQKIVRFSNGDYDKAELLKIQISEDIRTQRKNQWIFQLDSTNEKVTVNEQDFKDLLLHDIWPLLKSTVEKTISDANKSLDIPFTKLDFVLFAGGGSNLPFLTEFFSNDFKERITNSEAIVLIDKPQLAVSSGLAIDAKYKLDKTGDSLSDDEYLESDFYLDLLSRGIPIEKEIKIRLLENPSWESNGKIIDKELMKKEELIKNTQSSDKKPWEIKLKNHFDYNKLDYLIFEDEQRESQIDRSHFNFTNKPDRKKFDLDLFIDTEETGIATPKIRWKDGELISSQKPFELWSYSPSKEMIAIDLGNSTTSMFLITDDPLFEEVEINDYREITSTQEEVETNEFNDVEIAMIGTETQKINEIKSTEEVVKNNEEIIFLIEPHKEIKNTWKDDLISDLNIRGNLDGNYISINKVNREHIENWISKWEILGLFYEYEIVSHIIVTFQSGKIPVLYGPPGFGKSKLLELIADETKSNFCLIPVKPNWRDSSNLFGNNGQITEFQKAVFISNHYQKENLANPANCLICFDEMNLSHPEYYMADLLSILELNESFRFVHINGEKFPILSNLLLAGTINVDHTTKILSPKLKNRVKFIKFGDKIIHIEKKLNHLLDDSILRSEIYKKFIDLLIVLNDCLQISGINISYRVLDYFNSTLRIQFHNELLRETELYDYLLTSSVIPSLDFNKFSKNHEITITQISHKIINNPELEKFFPNFILNIKRIVEDFSYSTISGGLL